MMKRTDQQSDTSDLGTRDNPNVSPEDPVRTLKLACPRGSTKSAKECLERL